MNIFERQWNELKPLSLLWLIVAIIGNPIYNVLAYFTCTELGFSTDVSTNVVQVDKGMYVIILFIVFLLRYVIYRILYVAKLKDQMTTPFFLEVFVERHKFQVISALTFFMWFGEVDGDVAGFFYLPITLVLTFSVSVITFFRLFRMQKHLDMLKSK
ncbi:MAG: hypothetical protein OCD76_02970 [Reichenbachiella sp.]